MSQQFLGTQIDAIYHTSIVIEGIEYYFGQGIQTCAAGATHHGKPMEVIQMGQTALPMEIILEYLESLKTVYSAEVWLHRSGFIMPELTCWPAVLRFVLA